MSGSPAACIFGTSLCTGLPEVRLAMNRRSLGALAIVIILLMVVVAIAGLDNLPRDVRNAIAAAASRVDTDRAQLSTHRGFVEQAVREEPALFRSKASDYSARLSASEKCLAQASSELTVLQRIAEENRRTDAEKAREGLGKVRAAEACADDAAQIRRETERWLSYKRELPARLQSMTASYEALRSFDVEAAVPAVSKAMTDWPDKRDDLQARLDRLKGLKSEGDTIWQNTSLLRTAAASGPAEFDYATFFQSADRMDQIAREAKEGATGLNDLAGQLYVAWDKLLLEVDKSHDPPGKVRIVQTRFPDASLTNGQVTSEERWENVVARLKGSEDGVGMVVERKAAGKYDSEAERVVEPPAYARIAPPGQSNAYGSWQNGVWHWLPQYLILSHLLNMNRGPIGYNDYNAYDQARRRGEVFYGRNNEWRRGGATAGGGVLGRARDWASRQSRDTSGGGFYRERPKSWGSSGYSGSQYQNRGTYSGSRFQSRGGSYSRGGFGGMRSFGRGGRR
jgi:hypothetical protein